MPDDPRHGGGERGAAVGAERLTDRLNRGEADADDTRVVIAPFRDTFEARKMRRRAGSRAREQYKVQRKAWLKRKRWFFAGSAAALGLTWLAAHVLLMHVTAPTHPSLAMWFSGAAAGVLIGAFLIVRDSPPSVIESWQVGAWGEERTARKLGKLPRGRWDVVNDVGNGKYNFDHVLVGPAGVMCLNSKQRQYRLDVHEGARVVLTERYDEGSTASGDDMIRQARRDAFTLKQRIERQTGQHRLWVQPVIVWWGEFPDGVARVNDVDIVHGDRLVEWLGQLPARGLKDQAAVVAALKPGRRSR